MMLHTWQCLSIEQRPGQVVGVIQVMGGRDIFK